MNVKQRLLTGLFTLGLVSTLSVVIADSAAAIPNPVIGRSCPKVDRDYKIGGWVTYNLTHEYGNECRYRVTINTPFGSAPEGFISRYKH